MPGSTVGKENIFYMNDPLIETSRLLLRHWQPADLKPFMLMNADLDVMRFFPEPYSQQQSKTLFDRIGQALKEEGYGLYAVEEKMSGQFMGYIGFHRADFAADFCPCIEIAWRLDKAFWNKGYATEGARACLHHGFNHLGFTKINSFTAALNLPSKRIMQKIGMQFTCCFEHPGVPEKHPLRPHVLYEITLR